jgi:hypothetical protein
VAEVIGMYSFDENALVSELRALSSRARIAFAAAAATRQLGNYERLARELKSGNEQRPCEIAVQVWTDLRAAAIDRAA